MRQEKEKGWGGERQEGQEADDKDREQGPRKGHGKLKVTLGGTCCIQRRSGTSQEEDSGG